MMSEGYGMIGGMGIGMLLIHLIRFDIGYLVGRAR